MKESLANLSKTQTLKFASIIQGVLYLLGYTKEDINLPNTNWLDWKSICKNIISSEDFFSRLNN